MREGLENAWFVVKIKGKLYLKGEVSIEDGGFEYFDMTTEMATGQSNSYYTYFEGFEKASPEEARKVLDFLGGE